MNPYDKLVITLGNFLHEDRSLTECFLVLSDVIGMTMLFVFLGVCVFG